MDKAVKQIVDGTAPKRPDYRRPGRPMPAAEEMRRRPDEHMMWHLRHKPYGRGDSSAEQRD